jgi:hypothetical protein
LRFFEDGFEFIGEVVEFVEVEFVFGELELIFLGLIRGGIFEGLELVFEEGFGGGVAVIDGVNDGFGVFGLS